MNAKDCAQRKPSQLVSRCIYTVTLQAFQQSKANEFLLQQLVLDPAYSEATLVK